MDKKDFFPSEIRYDVISNDWVIIAKQRSKRPIIFEEEKQKISPLECPFCQIETQLPPLLVFSYGKEAKEKNYPLKSDWTVIVIPNKYPALLPGSRMERKKEGKYFFKISGIGYCELVITRDHEKHFPDFTVSEIKEIFDVYQKRYLFLKKKKFVKNISIFHNYGKRAGATQPHCHSQIITTPMIEKEIKAGLLKAKDFLKKNKKCIYCELQNWEVKEKERVVFENDDFVAICPFASRGAFEVIISPKKHLSYFEKINEKEKESLALVFSKIFQALSEVLGKNFHYNFYLKTAPCDGKDYSFFHWHWTIFPRLQMIAGFELGTRMDVCTISPEEAAQKLREKIKK